MAYSYSGTHTHTSSSGKLVLILKCIFRITQYIHFLFLSYLCMLTPFQGEKEDNRNNLTPTHSTFFPAILNQFI
jgi:hypothetical protein